MYELRIASIFIALTISPFANLLFCQPMNTQMLSKWDDNSLSYSSQGVQYSDLWGVAIGGREYAIMGAAQYTVFIDVTDPNNPVEVDREWGGSTCTWRDYKVFGHFAYGIADNCNAGLEIFDLSTLPDSVNKVYDSNFFVNDTHNVFIDSATAKLYACGFNSGTSDIVILDLGSDPANPTLIKNLDLASGSDGYVHDMYVRNDTAYCAHIYQSKLVIYDLSDPDNARALGELSTSGYNHSNWLSEDGKTMIVADETHNQPLRLAAMADIEKPTVVSTIKSTLLAPDYTNSIAHNPFILHNRFAIISYYEDGLQIYKIDSIATPFRAGYYDTRPSGTNYSGYNGAWGVYPFLPSGNILVSDIDNGLFVIRPQFPMKDCESNPEVSGIYDHFWELVSADSITISATYVQDSKINALAPQNILLEAGFEIEMGAEFSAVIDDECSTPASLKSEHIKKPIKRP